MTSQHTYYTTAPDTHSGRRGMRAHRDGKPVTANPYDPARMTCAHMLWRAGWLLARDERAAVRS